VGTPPAGPGGHHRLRRFQHAQDDSARPRRGGAHLDAAVRAAGDPGRLQGISYEFSNPGPLLEEARIAAAKDAHAKAKTLAAGASVRLGKVLSVTEVAASGDRPQPRMREMAMMASTPVEPGRASLSVAVTIRYAIKG
jgi:uncharacterized protein YggE